MSLIQNDPKVVKWLEEEALKTRAFKPVDHRRFLELLEDVSYDGWTHAYSVAKLDVIDIDGGDLRFYLNDGWKLLYPLEQA